MTPSNSKHRGDKIALTLVFAVLACSTIWWTLRDKTPPPWDPSDHLIAAYDYYRPLAHADFSDFAREFFSKTHYYAPLVHLGTAVFFLLFGASRVTGIAINLVSMGILLSAVYWIGDRLYGMRDDPVPHTGGVKAIPRSFANPAVLAALLAACYHFPAWLLHDAFLDYPLTAIVALSFALLIRAGDFQNRRHALLFGLSAGLGMLTKQTFAFFLLLPAVYVVGRVLIKRDRAAVVNLMLAGLLALGVAAVWYAPHLRDVIAIYRMNQQAALDENEAPLFSFMSNTVYIHGLLSLHIQILFGAVFLCGGVYQAWSGVLARKGRPRNRLASQEGRPRNRLASQEGRPRNRLASQEGRPRNRLASQEGRPQRAAPTVDSRAGRRQGRLILYLWILSGIVCFTLIANKDMRYTIPVLPAVALVSVGWLSGTRRKSSDTADGQLGEKGSRDAADGAANRYGSVWRRLRVVVVCLAVIWAFISFFNAQWPRAGMGSYIDTPRFRWMVFARNYFGFDHRPLPEDWGVPEVVSAMSQLTSEEAATSPPKLGVVVNLPYLNPSSVALYARLQSHGRAGAPLVTVIWLVTKSTADQISDCDYLLVRTGLDKADWLAPLERYTENLIRANPSRFSRIAAFPIPLEGAEAVLYKYEKDATEDSLQARRP